MHLRAHEMESELESESELEIERTCPIAGEDFVRLFRYYHQRMDRTTTEQDKQNAWHVYPLSVFQETALMHAIGVDKSQEGTVRASLELLHEVPMRSILAR